LFSSSWWRDSTKTPLLTGETLINVVYLILCNYLFIFHISPFVLCQLESEPNSIVFHNNRPIHCHPSHTQTVKKKKKKKKTQITSPFKHNLWPTLQIFQFCNKAKITIFCSTQSPIHKHQQTKVHLRENNTKQPIYPYWPYPTNAQNSSCIIMNIPPSTQEE
jgi:hypothetical protein